MKFKSQNKSWMTFPLFSLWFLAEFVPVIQSHLTSVELEQCALLLVDNAGSQYEKRPIRITKQSCQMFVFPTFIIIAFSSSHHNNHEISP